MIAFLDFPAILSSVDPPTLVASIARTGEDRRGQVPIWGLRPRLFASAPPLGWTDAPEAANGMFLVRHASRHVSGGEPASIQPDTDFFVFPLQRPRQYRRLDSFRGRRFAPPN